MERVIAYVDGYNLYYGLKDEKMQRFYWLNIQKLVQQFLKPTAYRDKIFHHSGKNARR